MICVFFDLDLEGEGGPPNEGIVQPVAKKNLICSGKKNYKKEKKKKSCSFSHTLIIHFIKLLIMMRRRINK